MRLNLRIDVCRLGSDALWMRKPNNFPKGKSMKLRRAISALGMAFALSFGLMLAPSQASAATLTINPRANAVEAGQVLAAPDGSVFSVTVYDENLAGGEKSVSHAYQSGNTLRQTANKIVQAINADTDLQAVGVTATLQNGANYTISSTSTKSTVYKQTTTGGGTNRLAIQQALTIGGTVTVDDKLTLTIYDAGLVGGKEAVVYRPNTGDTLADIVIRLRNKINNSTGLSALDITAKVSPTDSNVLLIESPTFDATEKFTSYSAVVKAGGTETMTLGAFWGTNGAQTISVTGPVTAGETVKFTIFNEDLPDLQKEVSYVVQTGDNLNQTRCGLRNLINNDPDFVDVGVHATCSGGVLTVTSTSSTPTTFLIKPLIVCIPVINSPTQWPAAEQVKYCTFSNVTNAQRMRSTLEQIGANGGGGNIQYASDKLKTGQFTVYLFANHNDFYDSASTAIHRTGGPSFSQVFATENVTWPQFYADARKTILGFSVGNEFSLIFETSQDRHETQYISNNYMQHATAHEMGHQFSFLANNMAKGTEFTQAWQFDLDGMGLASSCKYNAHAANTDPPQPLVYDGIFTNAIDYQRNYVCGSDGQGFGGAIPTAMLGAKYPYFSQFSNKPVSELPTDELFAEYFAYRAGFPDFTGSDGSLIDGSNQAFETSGALACTSVYMIEQFRNGQTPITGDFGYSFQASDTETGVLRCSDGAITIHDNPGT